MSKGWERPDARPFRPIPDSRETKQVVSVVET